MLTVQHHLSCSHPSEVSHVIPTALATLPATQNVTPTLHHHFHHYHCGHHDTRCILHPYPRLQLSCHTLLTCPSFTDTTTNGTILQATHCNCHAMPYQFLCISPWPPHCELLHHHTSHIQTQEMHPQHPILAHDNHLAHIPCPTTRHAGIILASLDHLSSSTTHGNQTKHNPHTPQLHQPSESWHHVFS